MSNRRKRRRLALENVDLPRADAVDEFEIILCSGEIRRRADLMRGEVMAESCVRIGTDVRALFSKIKIKIKQVETGTFFFKK